MRFGIENKNVAMAGGHTAQFSPFNMGPNESQQSKDAQSISKYQGSRFKGFEETSYDQLDSKIHFESLC